MIPLNLSSLTSSYLRLNRCESSAHTSSADRRRRRPNAAADDDDGGRSKKVRFADDELRKKVIRKRRGHQRESSNRRRQTTETDENKGNNTMDKQRPNFVWSDSPHLFHPTAIPVMTMTASTKSDGYENDEDRPPRMSTTGHGRKFPSIPIPHDPRLWSRLDVYNWLEHMKSLEVDLGDLDAARFLMNGKALCLMTPAMFIYRVPHGGRILYKDFQMRLSRAVAEVHHKKCIAI